MSTWPSPDHPYAPPTPAAPDSFNSGWHPVSTGHLVMGIAFLGMAAIWAALQGGIATSDTLSWLLPVPWLAAGAIGLTAIALGSRRRRTAASRSTDHAEEMS